MRIKQIIHQYRRYFDALYECEWCEHEFQGEGYDDYKFHHVVIPAMKCPDCGNKKHESYRPLTTKYPEGFQI